jgi:hypothetical protein
MSRYTSIYLLIRTLYGCKFWQITLQHYFVGWRNFHWPHWRFQGTLLYILGEGGPGFWLCDIASLVMYCNDASLRIVTKSLLHLILYSMVLDDIETLWRSRNTFPLLWACSTYWRIVWAVVNPQLDSCKHNNTLCGIFLLYSSLTEQPSIEIKWTPQDVSELGYLFLDSPVCI